MIQVTTGAREYIAGFFEINNDKAQSIRVCLQEGG